MLIRLLRTHLRPYRRPLAAVVALQLVATIASLYLPSLNADIIDNGVVTGDTGYIWRTGAVMLGVTLVQIICSIARGLLRRAGGDGVRPRRPRRALHARRRRSRRARSATSVRRR